MSIYYYSIGSAAFLLVFVISYFTSKKTNDKKGTYYSLALISSLIAVVFDALASLCERYTDVVPTICIYLFNALFMFGMHSFLLLLVFYFIELTNIKLMNGYFLLVCIPYFLVIFLIALSPFTHNAIFYVDENNNYIPGTLHFMLYVSTIYYLLVYIVIFIIKRKMIRKLTIIVLTSEILIGLVLVLIQINHKTYLLTASATAIAAVMMFYVLQLPSRFIDSQTGFYNRITLPTLLANTFAHKSSKTMILISINSLNKINEEFGNEVEAQVINYIALCLKKTFPNCKICRVYYAIFAIIMDTSLFDKDKLQNSYDRISEVYTFDKVTLQYEVNFSVFNEIDFANITEILNVMDYVIYEKKNTISEILYINKEMINEYYVISMLENDINKLIDNNCIEICYKKIFDNDDNIVSLDAFPYINTDDYKDVSVTSLKNVAIRCNVLNKLAICIFNKINDYMHSFEINDIPYIMISLPIELFSDDKITDMIINIFGLNDKIVNKVILSFVEKQFSTISSQAFDSIKMLNNKGYNIIFDEFGVGYTNSDVLLNIKLFGVRINNTALSSCLSDEARLSFIMLVYNITKDIDVRLICKGYKDNNEKKIITQIGVKYFQ